MAALDTLLPASFAEYFADRPERLERFRELEAEMDAMQLACKPSPPVGPEVQP